MRTIAMLTCVVVGASTAAAQPMPPPSPSPSPASAPAPAPAPRAAPTVPAPADARADAGWQLYHDAFAALLDGKRARARSLSLRLLREHPGHPATRSLADARGPLRLDEALDRRPRVAGELPSKGAQAELALFQGLHGVVLGVELGLLIEADEAAVYFLLALAGGVAGGALSVSAVPELTSGKRALLNSGTVWGAVNAGLILLAIDPDSDSAAPIIAPLMVGQLGGLAAGAALFHANPTAGQVGLANSGGQWAGAITGLLLAATDAELSDETYALTILGAVDAGLLTGAYLAGQHPQVSRAQTLLIDAGGIFGAVAGGGLAVLAKDDFDRTAALGAAVGAAAGLGVAAYLTRDWGTDRDGDDADETTATTYLAPTQHGRGAVAGMGWRW